MPERKALICWLVSLEGYVTPGSLKDKCSKCGQPVWVAPSSWFILYDNPEMEPLCILCAVEEMKKDKEFEIGGITPAQAVEVLEYLNSR